MIPAAFDYVRAESAEQAISLIAEHGEDAKFLAGGHSLLPLMKLRLAAPSVLVDIGRLKDLSYVREDGDTIAIGALTRHMDVQNSPVLAEHVPLLAHAAGYVGDPQVRHRGTIGGSLAHGDSASDLPAAMLICEAEVTLQGQSGQRTVAAADLFKDYMTTALAEDEVLTEIRLAALDGYGHAYQKFTRRAEDWAMAGVCAVVKVSDGVVADARVGLTNLGSVPLRATAVEQALQGQPATAESFAAAAEHAAEGINPPSDLNASTEYKQHLARVLTRRALADAAANAG